MQVTIKYGIDSATKTYTTAPSVAQIKADANLRGALGYGDRINVLVNGVAQNDDAIIAGGEVVIETAANQKAGTITVAYGADHLTKSYSTNPTFLQLKQDRGLRAALGYGDNVNMLVNGVKQNDYHQVPNNVTVVVETAANQKAS